MGTFKFKKRKDWKAKFRKPEPTSDTGSLQIESISPVDIHVSEKKEWKGHSRYSDLTLRERNKVLLEAVNGIFDLPTIRRERLKYVITKERIRELYEGVAELWPPDTDVINLIPPPSSNLRAMYLGDAHPDSVLRNICRFGLYADELFIVDPFHNPHTMKDEFNPLIHPEQFQADTLTLLHFIKELTPWLDAGLVMLIPDPSDFDFELRDKTIESARKLAETWEFTREELDEILRPSKEEHRRFFMSLPDAELAKLARKATPEITDQQVRDVLDYFKSKSEEDPLTLDESIIKAGGQLTTTRTGHNLDTTLYLSGLTGAFPYTNLKWKWRQLLSVGKELPEPAHTWSPLTKAFQDLEFTFLNKVDAKFACEMRADGRLESFRHYLRRVWKSVDGEPEVSKIESIARDFKDQLVDEYRKAKADWRDINKDLVSWTGASSASSVGAITGALITGNFLLAIPTLGFASWGIAKLVESRIKQRQFREKVPMSVFVDLSKYEGST